MPFTDPLLMAAEIKTIFEEAKQGQHGTSHSIHIFHGHRVPIVGDPIRNLVLPDGTKIPLNENQDDAADDGRLLPPSLRGVFVSTTPVV